MIESRAPFWLRFSHLSLYIYRLLLTFISYQVDSGTSYVTADVLTMYVWNSSVLSESLFALLISH